MSADTEWLSVNLNGLPLQVPRGTDLATMLSLAVPPVDAALCATAINGHFVARAARAGTRLCSGDAVTTFQAIVGG